MSSCSADFWQHLKEYTSACIALGRTGNNVPTSQLLNFQLAHAQARDAVHKTLAHEELELGLSTFNLPLATVKAAQSGTRPQNVSATPRPGQKAE